MWNSNAEVAGHATLLYSIGALLILAIAASGWVALRSWDGATAVLTVGLLSLAVGLGSAIPSVRHAVAQLPGGGLLRDATRYLPGWILLVALGFAVALETVRLRLRDTDWAHVVALLIVLPAVILPAVGWGIGGRLHPVAYPSDIRRGGAAGRRRSTGRRRGGTAVHDLPRVLLERLASGARRASPVVQPPRRLRHRPADHRARAWGGHRRRRPVRGPGRRAAEGTDRRARSAGWACASWSSTQPTARRPDRVDACGCAVPTCPCTRSRTSTRGKQDTRPPATGLPATSSSSEQ